MANSPLKTIAGTTLGATMIATKAAKYGVHLSLGVSKVFLNGASALADKMAESSFKLGIGDWMMKETENVINKGFDALLKVQKSLRGKAK